MLGDSITALALTKLSLSNLKNGALTESNLKDQNKRLFWMRWLELYSLWNGGQGGCKTLAKKDKQR